MAEPLKRLEFLGKRVLPQSPQIPGSAFMPRADHVLRHLAQASDEREYQRMIDTETSISSAIDQRITGLLEEGWEWAPGASGSTLAHAHADFVGSFTSDPDLRLATVLREMVETIFLGWRPCETIWKVEPWGGAPRLVPSRIICHEPHRFKFTTDGKLAMTQTGGLAMAMLFDLEDPTVALKWQIATAGSTRSPYGRSWLQKMWLLWFVRHEFAKMTDKAIARALGVFRAKYTAGKLGESVPGSVAQITDELSKVFSVLDANNVLVELSGWSLEAVDFKTDLVGNLDTLFRYYDDQFRIAIVGQTLTSSQGQRGSQALGRVHQQVLAGYQRSDGRQLQVWMNTLARRMIEANFGPQDPRDFPSFTLRMFSRPDLEATAMFYNMRGPIDGAKFAERFNVPALLKPAADDFVLLRGESEEVTMPGTQTANDTTKRQPSARSDVGNQVSAIHRIASSELGPAGVDELYRSTVDALLRENPDPR
jgi:hypothetical protein